MINYFETFEYRKASIGLRELFDEIQKGKSSAAPCLKVML